VGVRHQRSFRACASTDAAEEYRNITTNAAQDYRDITTGAAQDDTGNQKLTVVPQVSPDGLGVAALGGF
jgi:hypothetical protein